MKTLLKAAVTCVLVSTVSGVAAEDPPQQWWRGNTHTHSWWSDGDMPPELITEWYKDQGYDFLVISDHNVMQQGETWYSIDSPRRSPERVRRAYDTYLERFGETWVESREHDGELQVKLKTLDEFRGLFEEPGEFILIKGEEITDRFERHPVHMGGVNLVEVIEPQGGSSVADTIQNNLDAVVAQSEQYGQPMVVHLNHPNFHYAQTAEDFFNLDHEPGEGFFEMYNGHAGVNGHGDALHQSSERLWDIVLSKRLGELGRSVIYGVATDDAHDYTHWGGDASNPGRGWMMVRSRWLTPNEITSAVKRGDFYNSTGVQLKALEVGGQRIALEIDAEEGVEYKIEFVGTMRGADLEPKSAVVPHAHQSRTDHLHKTVSTWSRDIGQVLQVTEGASAVYRATGDELYVRARITSSKLHDNPHAEGDYEMAWTQPLVVGQAD
ncbi:PHP domain-containing protein [Parahaliea mediterranea]|uniref:Histidinol-phosphatase n=1 Tax=Parahaliea mediterranea TaxID=651086 RepID=A0A939DDI9_9GAMM|nr:hypothetical protein [Parahaliea mediterranea]MBN7796105.1 hypothetical protein [Parahaliea mediterranea]